MPLLSKTELESLYSKIHKCSTCYSLDGCIRPDSEKVQRKVFENTFESEILIVGQSLAADQVRLSGIPYHNVSGVMGRGGVFLEPYLNKIGYSLSPKKEIYKYAYTTDAVKCYPGKKANGSGDNKPSSQEIENCKKWLLEETKLLNFKVIILMGAPAIITFFSHYLSREINGVTEHFGKRFEFKINSKNIPSFCLPHPTSMVVGKSEIFRNTFDSIKNILLN